MAKIKSDTNQFVSGDLGVGRSLSVGGDLNLRGDARVEHGLAVKGWLDAPNVLDACKGFFRDYSSLKQEYPMGQNGWWALVGHELPAAIWRVENHVWVDTGATGGEGFITDAALKALLDKLAADLKSEISRVDGLISDLSSELNSAKELVDSLMEWSAEAEAELQQLMGERGSVELQPMVLPMTQMMHWCEVLSWTDATSSDEIRNYFMSYPGLWKELFDAASGATNRGIYVLGDDSYRKAVFKPGSMEYEEVAATTWGRIRLHPISTSENQGGQSCLLGYESTGSDKVRHEYRIDLYHSKDDKVYQCRTWEVTAAGGGGGGGEIPADVESRLRALENLVTMV